MVHDISLLQLDAPVDYTPMTVLDTAGGLGSVDGTLLTVAGWGTVSHGSYTRRAHPISLCLLPRHTLTHTLSSHPLAVSRAS
jgi:hypothetical protein